MLMGVSTPGASTIASTIQQVEGYYPGTLAYKNNNPGNLIFVGQAGATPGAGGFAAFPSYDAGYQALLNQIQNYANRGLTIQQMMNIYAPATDNNGNPTGNNPTLYANQIASALGVSTDTTVAAALGGGTTADTSSSTGGTDSMTIPSLDPFSQAFSDFGTAVSSGDVSSVSGQDFLVLGGMALGLWMVVGMFSK
jgi:hypothetical protein